MWRLHLKHTIIRIKNSSIWQESITCIFLGYELTAGGNLGGDALIADLEDLEKLGRIRKFILEESTRKKY